MDSPKFWVPEIGFFSQKHQLLSVFAYSCNFDLLFIFFWPLGIFCTSLGAQQYIKKYMGCNLPSSSSFHDNGGGAFQNAQSALSPKTGLME